MEEFGDRIEVEVAGISRVISPNAGLSKASKWSDDIKAGLPIATIILLLALLPNLLHYSMALPSMRSVSGILFDGTGSWPYPEAISEVVELDMRSCAIDGPKIQSHLRGFRALRSFTFTYSPSLRLEDIEWEPRGIVTALKQDAFKILVYLELVAYGLGDWLGNIPAFRNGEHFIGSLRSFEVLETVLVDSMLLFEEVKGFKAKGTPLHRGSKRNSFVFHDTEEGTLVSVQRLVDFLPASARILEVVGHLEVEVMADTFAGLPELKDKRLPSLQMFSLETDDTLGVDMGKLGKKSGIWMRSCKAIIREEHAVFTITKPAR